MDVNPAEGSISVSKNKSDFVLKLRGSFQLEHARPLCEAAVQMAGEAGSVIVDCSEVEHLDGCAVQVLLALKIALERAGGSLRMSGGREDVRKYLAWAGVAPHFGCGEAAETTAAAGPRKRRKTARKRPV